MGTCFHFSFSTFPGNLLFNNKNGEHRQDLTGRDNEPWAVTIEITEIRKDEIRVRGAAIVLKSRDVVANVSDLASISRLKLRNDAFNIFDSATISRLILRNDAFNIFDSATISRLKLRNGAFNIFDLETISGLKLRNDTANVYDL